MTNYPIDPFTPAAELAAAIRRKQVSPVEAADCYLDRIDQLDPRLNAFCCPAVSRRAAPPVRAKSSRWTRSAPRRGCPCGHGSLPLPPPPVAAPPAEPQHHDREQPKQRPGYPTVMPATRRDSRDQDRCGQQRHHDERAREPRAWLRGAGF